MCSYEKKLTSGSIAITPVELGSDVFGAGCSEEAFKYEGMLVTITDAKLQECPNALVESQYEHDFRSGIYCKYNIETAGYMTKVHDKYYAMWVKTVGATKYPLQVDNHAVDLMSSLKTSDLPTWQLTGVISFGEGAFDLLTVSETAQDAITDDKENINGVPQLSRESTAANDAYAQQVLGDEPPVRLGEADELAQGSVPSAYKYRAWRLSDAITLVARCELNGVTETKGANATLCVKALTEFDSKVTGMDWRSKIETQRGAVIATELKNNANKLAKWTCCALLAGADIMKLGFVSRAHPKDPANHVILNTQSYKPKDFAQQINLTEANMWGVFKAVAETTMKLPDGKYLLVKDPNKPTLRTYEVPEDAFDDGYSKEPLE